MADDELNKILYVEDDEDIAELTQMALGQIGGFTISHCSSGKEALEVFPKYKPQLILMDVMMPGMDGVETFNNLKNISSNAVPPVIFITAKAQTHEQDKYKEMGAIGVIVKPYDPMALCENIKKFWKEYNG